MMGGRRMKLAKALVLSLLLVGHAKAQPDDLYYEGMEAYFMAGRVMAPDGYPAMKSGFPSPIYQGEALRAVFADGKLWILSEELKVTTITPGATAPVQQALPGLPLDICAQDGSPVVVTGERGKAAQWTVRRWSGGVWTSQTHMARGDYFLAAECGADGPTLLTNKRLIGPGPRPRIVKLSRSLGEGAVAALYATPAALFVGLNGGEFGGGLRRIDRKTGRVTTIEKVATKDLCSGPLNTKCDPVHGIAPAPWNPECLAATVGLEHGISHGRVIEICGRSVRSVYWAPNPDYKAVETRNSEDGESNISTAFYGLARVGNALWASSPGGLYQITQPGAAIDIPLPRFANFGSFAVSFELPDVVLIRNIGYQDQLGPAVIVPR